MTEPITEQAERKHPDCEDGCQLMGRKGYHDCFVTGECAYAPASQPTYAAGLKAARGTCEKLSHSAYDEVITMSRTAQIEMKETK